MSYINDIMSFRTINLEEYKRLLNNKKKMYDMTFPTPESVNKSEILMIKSIKKF